MSEIELVGFKHNYRHPETDKLAVLSDQRLAEINQGLGTNDIVFEFLDIRHVGITNDVSFAEIVDAHLAFIAHKLNEAFAEDGIPFRLIRFGGDEFMAFYPNTPQAIAAFDVALENIEKERADKMEGFSAHGDEQLPETTAVRSIARSIADSVDSRLEDEFPSAEARLQTTTEFESYQNAQQQDGWRKAMAFIQQSLETCHQLENDQAFYEMLCLAIFQKQLAQFIVEHRGPEEVTDADKALGIARAKLVINQPLNSEVMARAIGVAEDKLSRDKREAQAEQTIFDGPAESFLGAEIPPETQPQEAWLQLKTQAERMEELLAVAEQIPDEAEKRIAQSYISSLDASVSVLVGEQPQRPHIFNEAKDLTVAALWQTESAKDLQVQQLAIDIPGFGAINNQMSYQIADQLLQDCLQEAIGTLTRTIGQNTVSDVSLKIIRQGGGTLKLWLLCQNQTDSSLVAQQLPALAQTLSEALNKKLAPIYQNLNIIAEITRKLVAGTLRLGETKHPERHLKNLTDRFSPLKVEVGHSSSVTVGLEDSVEDLNIKLNPSN